MVKLSVALATFNEEENLARTLSSVKDLADEIVIYDGGSTDKTVEIAKKFGAKVIVGKNYPIFHVNKQKAINACTGEWVLQLDADEVVSDELADEIKSEISLDYARDKRNPKSEINGYWIPRKNYFLGRFLMKGGQYPDYTMRLYRKGKGRLPQKDVHEQAIVEGRVGYLKNPLLHYPYKDFTTYLKKWNRYNNLVAEQIREEMKNKNVIQKTLYGADNLFLKPNYWLFTTYFRHKGFIDSWQGFVFSLFSALRFPVSYIKYVGPFSSAIILVLILSTILRFYNFNSRWGFAGDDARDAMIGLEAIRRMEIPLMGSFSSTGPFVFGGIYYWFIMLSYIILPFAINSPWIMTSVVGVLTVLVMIYIGKEIGGNKLAIIMGILASTSSQLLARSSVLGQHTFISSFSALLVLSFLLLWRTKKKIYAFSAGIFLGLALSFHYQALNLLVFLPAIFLISSLRLRDRFLSFSLMIQGFIITSLPKLYWDYFQGFANIRNIADYFLIGQYRFYVPNSWKLLLFDQFPTYWAFVVGKYKLIGLFLLMGSTAFLGYSLIKKKLTYKFIILSAIFFLFLILNRYYKGDRTEGYLLYFIPFILLITGWFLNQLIFSKNKIVKIIGFLIFVVILIGNLIANWISINYRNRYVFFKDSTSSLYEKFPNTKFAIYDYQYRMYSLSMPMSLIMTFDDKVHVNGKKIGISCHDEKQCPHRAQRIVDNSGFLIVDLETIPEKNVDKKTWVNVNKESVYDDLIGWLNTHQMKSTFSFWRYIFKN